MRVRSATWVIRRAVREGQHRVQTDAASSRNKHPWVKRMKPTGRPASDGREGNQKSPLEPQSGTGFTNWIHAGKQANSTTTRPIGGLTAFNCSIIIQSHLKIHHFWKDNTRHMPKQLAPLINPRRFITASGRYSDPSVSILCLSDSFWDDPPFYA